MRVTKTVREYIEKKVTEIYTERYSAEAAAAKEENEICNAAVAAAEKAAREAVEEIFAQYCGDYSFLEFHPEKLSCGIGFRTLTIRDSHYSSSVHRWRDRMNAEIKEKVSEIVVELELGGTKETLEKMLSEI